MEYTPEQLAKIKMVRILIGDTENSIFYPILGDDEIAALLILENWDVKRAARRAAISVAFQLTMVSYRERTGDIEVWNNASIEYQKVLGGFLDTGAVNLPAGIMPYAAGISKEDICLSNRNPDRARSPLSQIRTCDDWWYRMRDFYKEQLNGCGCSGC
jgi:hypothetical protein